MCVARHLVVVVLAVEERLLQEDHAGQHAAEAPHVQTVVVHLRSEEDRGTAVSQTAEDQSRAERPSVAVRYLIVH